MTLRLLYWAGHLMATSALKQVRGYSSGEYVWVRDLKKRKTSEMLLLLCFHPSSLVKESSTQQSTKQATSLDWKASHFTTLFPSILFHITWGFSRSPDSLPATSLFPLCCCSSSSCFIPHSSSPRLSAPPTCFCPIIGSSLYLKS